MGLGRVGVAAVGRGREAEAAALLGMEVECEVEEVAKVEAGVDTLAARRVSSLRRLRFASGPSRSPSLDLGAERGGRWELDLLEWRGRGLALGVEEARSFGKEGGRNCTGGGRGERERRVR